MKLFIVIIKVALLTIISNTLLAQKKQVPDTRQILGNSYQSLDFSLYGNVPYVFLGDYNGQTLICMQEKEGYKLKKFNDKMGLMYEMLLIDIPFEVENLVFLQKDTFFTAMYEVIEKKDRVIKKQLYGASFYAIGEPEIIAKIDYFKKDGKTTFKVSDNLQYAVGYNLYKDNDDLFTSYFVYNNNNSTSTKVLETEVPSLGNSTTLNMYITNYGVIHAISTTLNKDNSITDVYSAVIKEFAAKAKFTALDLGGLEYNYIITRYTSEMDKLYIALNHANSDDDNTGIVKLIIDSAKKVTKNTVVISNVTKRKQKVEGFSSYIPRQLLISSDGSIIIASEFYEMKEYVLGKDISALNTQTTIPIHINRTVKRYTYGDVLITKIDSANNVIWQETMHKEQVSDGDEGLYSSFSLLKLKKDFWIYFNAQDKLNTIQQAQVDLNGEFRYQILNDRILDLNNAVFNKYKQISATEIIIPCEKNNTFSFVKVSQ